MMTRMEFMQRHIDGQLCGIEFCARYVNYGSRPAGRCNGLAALEQSRGRRCLCGEPRLSMPGVGLLAE